MTIAGVYLSPEGVVLGADSTSSVNSNDGFHFYDFNQKLFEIGDTGTLALLTWGLGGLGTVSYRTILAEFADELQANPAPDFNAMMQRWVDKFWAAYSAFQGFQRFNALHLMAPLGSAPNANGVRTPQEEQEWKTLQNTLGVGFCIAGYVLPSRSPEAQTVWFAPAGGKPAVKPINMHSLSWFGVPNFFNRLLSGADGQVLNAIEASGKWSGNRADLDQIVAAHTIVPNGVLPIRDAVDYVHTCIHCTIKAIKFSGLPQTCGGPIEIAVISSDRKFRWVRHKQWDAAITEGLI